MTERHEFYMSDGSTVVTYSLGEYTACMQFENSNGVIVHIPTEYELIDGKRESVAAIADCYVMNKLQEYQLLNEGSVVLNVKSSVGHVYEQVFQREQHH